MKTFRDMFNEDFSSWPEVLADAPPDVAAIVDKDFADLTPEERNILQAFAGTVGEKVGRIDQALYELVSGRQGRRTGEPRS
jgi:hypothetical protein